MPNWAAKERLLRDQLQLLENWCDSLPQKNFSNSGREGMIHNLFMGISVGGGSGPRSLLYRRQILQENIHWKALDEIYKIYMLLHRSDLNISENFRQTFSHFRQNFARFTHFRKIFTEFLLRV